MKSNVPHSEKDLNAREINIRFSPAVTGAFSMLATKAQKSPFFDSEMASILAQWSAKGRTTVHDFLISIPLISEQMAEHVKATGDESMKDAWRELCMQMPEDGFVVSRSQERSR